MTQNLKQKLIEVFNGVKKKLIYFFNYVRSFTPFKKTSIGTTVSANELNVDRVQLNELLRKCGILDEEVNHESLKTKLKGSSKV